MHRCDFQQNAKGIPATTSAANETGHVDLSRRNNDEAGDQDQWKKLSISVCVRQRFGVCARYLEQNA